MGTSFRDQPRPLVQYIASRCSSGLGFGSTSSSIYDTAWLSMIEKPKGSGMWLFPECFDFVLKNQLPSGAWESYATHVDGILNTAAALLALKRHSKEAGPEHPEDLTLRSGRAEAALRHMLEDWDSCSSDQVGFEMLVVQHVFLLAEEGVVLDFPQLTRLRAMRDAKFAKLPAAAVYKTPSTLLHSLKALIGYVDFDQVGVWREENGSMMGSPSSTAAYLMNASSWDHKAEDYLRNVLGRNAGGDEHGSVPCAWPTTIFETSWTVTTLAQSGFSFCEAESSVIAQFLEESLLANNGIIGFTPHALPDVDDTARTIMALRCLGRGASVDPMIQAFEGEHHFRTYQGERNPSFSANCNVFSCLLSLDDPAPYAAQIAKTATFLCCQAFDGNIRDKWHLHESYCTMLLAQALAQFYGHDSTLAEKVFDIAPALRNRLPMVSLSVLSKTLQSAAGPDGLWDGRCETTAYAVLALSSLSRLPWIHQLHDGRIDASISRGQTFLTGCEREWTRGAHIWVEKVSYASNVLSEAYCLAAAHVPVPAPRIAASFGSAPIDETMLLGMRKASALVGRTPLFAQAADPQAMRVAELLACFAFNEIRRQPHGIFEQVKAAAGQGNYLIFVPLTWTASSTAAIQENPVSLSVLFEMMVLSILVYQMDEYMEGVVSKSCANDPDEVKALIRQIFAGDRPGMTDGEMGGHEQEPHQGDELHADNYSSRKKRASPHSLDEVKSVFGRYKNYVLRHPAVLRSSRAMQASLAFELETFLAAHVVHAEDNQRLLAVQPDDHQPRNNTCANPGRTFYRWVRSTSADHTSCPFAFVFFNCLVAAESRAGGVYATPRTAYLAEDLCRHLASLCRMYNDYASLARDRRECNLNSLDFPEFDAVADSSSSSLSSSATREGDRTTVAKTATGSEAAKDELMWIAEYERRGLDMATAELERELGNAELMNALKLYICVTDLYGQIYLQRDLSTRMG